MFLNLNYLYKHPELFQYAIGVKYSQVVALLPKFSLSLRKYENKYAWRFPRLREPGGGRKPHLKDDFIKLFFILFYYKVYPTFRLAQFLFGFDKRNCQLWVKRLETILFETLEYQLDLPSRTKRVGYLRKWIEVVPELHEFIVDCTERYIQRPKDKDDWEYYYSGKRKKHTVKNQIIVDPRNKKIIAVSDTVEGKRHDKRVFEENPLFLKIPPGSRGMGDSAYEGVNHPFLKFVIPIKKPPGEDLSEEMKQNNHVISSIRVRVEHPISYLKHFNILAQTFRSSIKHTDIPFKTISAIYNFTRTHH